VTEEKRHDFYFKVEYDVERSKYARATS